MKSGLFTSEFWVTIVTGMVTTICQAIGVDPEIQKALITLALAYLASRTAVKVTGTIKNGKPPVNPTQ